MKRLVGVLLLMVILFGIDRSASAAEDSAQVSVSLLPGPFRVELVHEVVLVGGQPQPVIGLVVEDSRGAGGIGWQVGISCTCSIQPVMPVEWRAGQPLSGQAGPRFDTLSNTFIAEAGFGVGIYVQYFYDLPGAWQVTVMDSVVP